MINLSADSAIFDDGEVQNQKLAWWRVGESDTGKSLLASPHLEGGALPSYSFSQCE